MTTIDATVRVQPGKPITVLAPPDIPAGEYRVRLTIDAPTGARRGRKLRLPVDDYGPWPVDLSLRREELYGEWGR